MLIANRVSPGARNSEEEGEKQSEPIKPLDGRGKSIQEVLINTYEILMPLQRMSTPKPRRNTAIPQKKKKRKQDDLTPEQQGRNQRKNTF